LLINACQIEEKMQQYRRLKKNGNKGNYTIFEVLENLRMAYECLKTTYKLWIRTWVLIKWKFCNLVKIKSGRWNFECAFLQSYFKVEKWHTVVTIDFLVLLGHPVLGNFSTKIQVLKNAVGAECTIWQHTVSAFAWIISS
jgi:hypothetical protein